MITHEHSFSLDANLAYPWLMASALLILSCNTFFRHASECCPSGQRTFHLDLVQRPLLCALCFLCFCFGFHRALASVLPFVRSRLATQHLHLNFPIDCPIVVNVVTETSILSLS